jgi:hypothetical protein
MSEKKFAQPWRKTGLKIESINIQHMLMELFIVNKKQKKIHTFTAVISLSLSLFYSS